MTACPTTLQIISHKIEFVNNRKENFIMTVMDFIASGVELQGEFVYCYYDYDKCERVILSPLDAFEKRIKYIYCERNTIYIEVDYDE